jgi:positive regulator of sigma E activity
MEGNRGTKGIITGRGDLMKENGKVIEVTGGSAVIEVAPREVCTKCCSCRASELRRITISGEKAKGLKEGDLVEIDIEAAMMLRIYILLYGIPLAAFLGSLLAVYAVFRSPIISFLGGMAGTVIVYMAAGYYIRKKRMFSPNVCLRK